MFAVFREQTGPATFANRNVGSLHVFGAIHCAKVICSNFIKVYEQIRLEGIAYLPVAAYRSKLV